MLLMLMRTRNGVERTRYLLVLRGAQGSNKSLNNLGQSEGQIEYVLARLPASLRKDMQRHRTGGGNHFSHAQRRKSTFLS